MEYYVKKKKTSDEDYYKKVIQETEDKYKTDLSTVSVNAFLDKANKYLSSSSDDLRTTGYSTATKRAEERRKQAQELRMEALGVDRYLDYNRATIDKNTYDTLKRYVSEIGYETAKVTYAFDTAVDIYNERADRAKYREASQHKMFSDKYSGKTYSTLREVANKLGAGDEKNWVTLYAESVYTPEEGKAVLDKLTKQAEADQKEYWDLYELRSQYAYGGANLTNPDASYKGIEARMQQILDKYGAKNVDDIKAYVSREQQHNTLLDRDIERKKMVSVGDSESENYDPEFSYWAKRRDKLPTVQEVENYDIMMNKSTWQTRDDGTVVDMFGNEITRDEEGNIVHPSEGSVNAEDRLGIYLASKGDNPEYSVAENTWGTLDKIIAEGDSRHWDRLTSDQIDTYYYYLNKEGTASADRYLDLIQDTVNKTVGEEMYTEMQDDSKALKALFGLSVGTDQWGTGLGGFGRQLRGEDDYVAPSAKQYAGQMVRKELNGGWGFAYDSATTIGNMAPSILTSIVANAILPGSSVVGSLVMGASASGNAYDQMINEGYSVKQARTYGTLVGASEVALQELLGGISAMGGGAVGKWISAADNAIFRVAAKVGDTAVGKVIANAISEGTEEGLQEIIGTWLKNMITHSDENVNWDEVAYSTLLGALTGGVFEAPSVAADAVVQNKAYRDVGNTIIEAEGGVDSLKALALDLTSSDSKLMKQAEKVTTEANRKNAKKVGKLYEAVRGEVAKQNREDIAKHLSDKGFSSTSAKNIAEAIAAHINGEKLNKYQEAVLNEVMENTEVTNAVNEVLNSDTTNISKRTTDLDVYSRGVAMGKGIAPDQTIRPKFDVSDEGKTILHDADGTARQVEIKKVSSIEDGKVFLELADGSVVDANNISFASNGEAWTYSVLGDLGVTPEQANEILSNYNGNTDIDRVSYARGVQEAYRYGSVGIPLSKISSTGYAAKMSDGARSYAYNLGAMQAVTTAANKQIKNGARKIGKGKYYTQFTQERNGVHYDDVDISKERLNAQQKTGIQLAEFLAATGLDVHVYKSKMVNGKYDRDNGTYYAADGSIHVDLNAGNKGEGLVAYTLSHETTHFIKDWSAEKYKVFADSLFEEMGKTDADIEGMVKVTLERVRGMKEYKGYSEEKLWDVAYDEVVAEMCETMLTDNDTAVKVVEKLKKTDSELLNKIIEFFDNLLTKLKNVLKVNAAYKDTESYSYIAQQAKETIKNVERLRDLYADALVDATQTYNTVKQNQVEYAEQDMTNEEAFEDSNTAVLNQIRPPYSDGSKAFNAFVDDLNTEARKTFDLFYGFYQKSRITNTMSVTGKRVKAVNISSLYLLAQDWNDMLAKEPKWAAAAKELADFLPADIRKRMNMNDDGTLTPTMLEKEFKMPSSMAQRLVDALPVEAIEATYRMGNKEITLPEGKARQSVGGEAYRRAIIDETRKLFAEGKLKQVSIGTMSKDRWGSLGFLAANGKTGASGDFTTVCPQMMFNRGCWYCYRRAAMEKGVNNKLVAQSVWYTGEILRIKDSDVTALNRNGGLRIQSFGDWMPHFSSMLADVLYDAEQRGLQIKIITKEPSMINYIAALRDQGIGKNLYFNLSADYTIERGPAKQATTADSLDAVNPERPFMRYDNSYWWKRAMTVEEAAKYREKYPWVNTRIVATTQEEFIRGLKDPKVDVVTGYHGNIREFERVDSATGEHKVQVEALGDAGMPRFAFNPMTGSWTVEYEGKTSTHKKLAAAIAENNLQMEYYTKTCCITGRCATCQGKCGALARDFNVKNATNRDAESVAYWQQEMMYGIEPEFGDMTEQGEVRYALRGNYWYPNMQKRELREIEDIAKNRIYKDKNYVGIGVKFLYNTEKGHKYFALYSTANVKDPTILYASKGLSAEVEHDALMLLLNRKEQAYERLNTGSGMADRLLGSVGNAIAKSGVNNAFAVGTGSSTGNGSIHSGNKRKRLNEAFEACISNIEKTQANYDIDEQYLFAVDIGKLHEAQYMVNQASQKALGNKLGTGVENTIYIPDGHNKETGETVDFANAILDGIKKGETRTHKSLTRKWVGIAKDGKVIGRVRLGDPIVLKKGTQEYRDSMIEGTEYDIADGETKYYYPVLEVMDLRDNPRPILRNGNYGQYQFKSNAPVTYDDEGNVIPLSKRFDETNNDIRYSTRNTEAASNRELLAGALESVTEHELERKKLQEYKSKISAMEELEQKLTGINAQIKELSFGKGPKDKAKLSALKDEKIKTQNRINNYDKQLLRLESTAALQAVVERERKAAFEKAKAKYGKAADARVFAKLGEIRQQKATMRGYEKDLAIMEREFLRIAKEYEKKSSKAESLYDALKAEAKSHKQDATLWEKEFARLMRSYDAADRKAEQMQEQINRQRESARNKVENRRRTEMRHKIQKVVAELNDLLETDSKKRHVPDTLKKSVADALSILNMDTTNADERIAKYVTLIAKERAKAEPDQEKIDAYTTTMDNIRRQSEKMGQRLKELRDAYEDIQHSSDPDIANAYDPVIAGAIRELTQTIGNTSIKDMSIDQLVDVYAVYRMVLTRVRDANKALIESINASISELATDVISEVRAVGGKHNTRVAMLDPAKKFMWNNMKPVYAMEYIGSKALTHVFENVRAGEDVWAKDVTEARRYYLEKSKKYGYDKWDFDKKYHFESVSGDAFDLTLEQMLSLYAYSKRDQAHDHLRLGGFVFDSNIEEYKENGSKIVKYKVNTADAHQIDLEILSAIIGNLTHEQMRFVDDMQDYLSTVMGAKGNEVTSKMYGVKLFNEKYYFPLKSAKQFMFEQNEVAGEVKIKNSGFTNKVVAKANNPVILSNFMDVWAGHVNDMSMYHAFTLPLEDFNRVFNYNSPKTDEYPSVSVKGTVQNAYGPQAVNYVKQLITDLNGGARTDPATDFINKLMGRFKKGAVFASASVVVQQPSAIARALALIDTKYFVGAKVDKKRHKALWDEVKQYAPVAIIKEMGYFDTNMGLSTQDFITKKEYAGLKEKAGAFFSVTDSSYRDEALSFFAAKADEITWCSIWDAVKRETKAKHPSMDIKSDAFLKLAGERFTEVIVKTQVYDSVLSRSNFMRSKDTGLKMVTAFMAEPTTSINMVFDALVQGKRGNLKYARNTLGAVVASIILNAMLKGITDAARDDDEDETYLEKYAAAVVGNIYDGINPMTYIPLVKDVISIFQGYDVERSDMAIVSDLYDAIVGLKSEKVTTYKKVENLAGSIFQLFGLPLKNIMRDMRSLYQAINSMQIVTGQKPTWTGTGYAVKSAFPKLIGGGEVSNDEQLYQAIIKGNAEHQARVEKRYATEKKAISAMRSAIKDHYLDGDISAETAINYMVAYTGDEADEAYWNVERWKYEAKFDEEFSKYDDFYTAVRTGKNLRETIKRYTDNGITNETLKTQLTEHFKKEYLKMSTAEKAGIKGYLLNAMTVLGNTRKEAEEKIKDWDFEAANGFSYGNRKQEYLEGDITREQLENALVNYGGLNEEEVDDYFNEVLFEAEYGFPYENTGKLYKDGQLTRDEAFHIFTTQGEMSEEKANIKIAELDFEIKYGYSYDNRVDAYKEGSISEVEMRSVLAENSNMDSEEIDNTIRAYNWMRENPSSDMSVTDALAYTKPIEKLGTSIEQSGIDPNTFVEYRGLRTECKGVDSDGDGTADRNSVKNQVLAVIDKLPISNAQKDALYYLNGWAASNIGSAPWH